PRAEMERVLWRVEDDGLRDRILIDGSIVSVSDSAAAQKAARYVDKISQVEVGDLPQPAPHGVNGEDLAALVGIRLERVGGTQEEGAAPPGIEEPGERVHASELRELHQLFAPFEKDLRDREALAREEPARWFLRNSHTDQVGARPEHSEGRNDMAVR